LASAFAVSHSSALVGALLLSLSACISTSSIDVPTQEPAVIEDRAVVDGKALPLPDEPLLSAESVGEAERVSPVVARLMASAQRQRKAGEWDDASGSLERALFNWRLGQILCRAIIASYEEGIGI